MNPHNDKTSRARGVSVSGGFTLTELLVVVGVLALLVSILVPSLHEAVIIAQRKSGCSANLRAIARGCSQYAMADKGKRLPSIFYYVSASSNLTGTTTWGNMTRGNPGCLWLVVKEGQVARNAFLCQEAGSILNWGAPPADATGFDYNATMGKSTLSYSYVSMTICTTLTTDPNHWIDRLDLKMDMTSVPSTMVVLADKNPRTVFGTQTLKTYAQLETEAGVPLGTKKKNSLNHRRIGQNMARWDGSVRWAQDPNDTNGNDIYSSSVTVAGEEVKGRRKTMDSQSADSFVLP